MLLPSDIARLVLGYLQDEGLYATSRAFIHESPNLKEYAEHTSEDGAIPACVFSIFGKGLTTILNEYVAVKTKESNYQVPVMMSSLWKKLDFTLNQIKSLQNSPALSACQRLRSRDGVANVARQRALGNAATGVVCTTVSETISIISPAQTAQSILAHSTPVSFSGPQRLTPSTVPYLPSQESGRLQNATRESPVQMAELRLNPPPMSPGRRKWKRGGVSGGASGSSRPVPASGVTPEEEPEETADGNFPQLVIQNARDKILGDRSLQEKLAENINKILSSDPTPQTSRACPNIVEPDQSIDEILGLQGEIHMSDDAIHDILEQTESDPAFQALFDLFECNKSKTADGESADGDISSSPVEDDISGPAPSSAVKPSQSVDSGVTHKDVSDPATVKANAIERKTRKSGAVLKKTFIPSNRNSRIENSTAHLLVTPQGTTPSKRSEKNPLPERSPMDVDEPQHIADVSHASAASTSNSITASLTTLASMVSDTANLTRPSGNKDAERIPVPPVPTSNPSTNSKDISLPALQAVQSSSPSPLGQGTQMGSLYPVSSEMSKAPPAIITVPTNYGAPNTSDSLGSLTTPTPSSVSSLSTPVANPSALNKAGDDLNDIVSLNIIISDNQDENSAADTALDQAISSISTDKIPTIYMSSPSAKTPAVPGTPKTNLDEAAQAVNCLQRSESVVASPLTGTSSQPQQSYIIQLPFDGAVPPAGSYFLFAEQPLVDAQSRQMIAPAPVSKGQAITPNHFPTTPQRQGFSAGSALILPSPIKPVVLPLSVVGTNTLGNMQMVSNQLVTVPNAPVLKPTETVKTLLAGAVKQASPPGLEKNVSNKGPPSLSSEQGAQNVSSPSSGHRRILRFDSSGESLTNKVSTAPSASTSQPLPRSSPRTKPAILGGNKPKRRIETVRCSETEKTTTVKKGSRKQEYNICNEEPSSNSGIADISKPTKPRRRSKSTDAKQNDDQNEDGNSKAKDDHHIRSLSSDSSQKSVGRKEKEPTEKGKSRDGRAEKRTQETTSVTANKENELKGQEQSATSSATAPTHAASQPKSSKAPSKTNALSKQAAEMLHDIQALNSPSTAKDLSAQEESGSDCPRTPVRIRKGRDGEGTPRHLVPPNSTDLPTCSPASEAGSESSINMAAHTLMILSRAALARTGTPLKNSLRQEGSGEQAPATTKNAKKRRQSTPTSSPPAKKELKRTPSKKKERKRLMECFPQDLDVDKFLSSLHYDE